MADQTAVKKEVRDVAAPHYYTQSLFDRFNKILQRKNKSRNEIVMQLVEQYCQREEKALSKKSKPQL